MRIVKSSFDGVAGQSPYAHVVDAQGHQLSPDFSFIFCVLRARLWALRHGHNPFMPKA